VVLWPILTMRARTPAPRYKNEINSYTGHLGSFSPGGVRWGTYDPLALSFDFATPRTSGKVSHCGEEVYESHVERFRGVVNHAILPHHPLLGGLIYKESPHMLLYGLHVLFLQSTFSQRLYISDCEKVYPFTTPLLR